MLCLDNLSKYILKVNDEEFQFIINNLKLCLDNYETTTYQEIITNYVIISHPTPLQKLLSSLLGEKIRTISDITIENAGQLAAFGQKVTQLAVNIHKIIKWHKSNHAIPSQQIASENRSRRFSLDSNYSNRSE